jgi:hypothetical protein
MRVIVTSYAVAELTLLPLLSDACLALTKLVSTGSGLDTAARTLRYLIWRSARYSQWQTIDTR